VKKQQKQESKKAEVLGETWTEIEFICPVRGWVKQKVKGVKYQSLSRSNPRYTAEDLMDDVAEAKIDHEDSNF
jgi:hypothetical protein